MFSRLCLFLVLFSNAYGNCLSSFGSKSSLGSVWDAHWGKRQQRLGTLIIESLVKSPASEVAQFYYDPPSRERRTGPKNRYAKVLAQPMRPEATIQSDLMLLSKVVVAMSREEQMRKLAKFTGLDLSEVTGLNIKTLVLLDPRETGTRSKDPQFKIELISNERVGSGRYYLHVEAYFHFSQSSEDLIFTSNDRLKTRNPTMLVDVFGKPPVRKRRRTGRNSYYLDRVDHSLRDWTLFDDLLHFYDSIHRYAWAIEKEIGGIDDPFVSIRSIEFGLKNHPRDFQNQKLVNISVVQPMGRTDKAKIVIVPADL